MTSNSFSFTIIMNEPSTVYFALQAKEAPIITFDEVKKKRINYDYLNDIYVLGETINNSTDFTYPISVSGIRNNKEYILHVWMQDLSGNMYADKIVKNIKTGSTSIVKFNYNIILFIININNLFKKE